jgi:hypothetical protein
MDIERGVTMRLLRYVTKVTAFHIVAAIAGQSLSWAADEGRPSLDVT